MKIIQYRVEMNDIEQIIDNLIKAIPFEGVSDNTLLKVCNDLQLAASFCKFQNGIYSALEHISDNFNKMMIKKLSNTDLNALKIREKIKLAIKIYLENYAELQNYREFIKNIISFSLHNPWFATKMLYNRVDNIWHGICDISTDFNYYTKRLTLASVYSSTILYFTNDYSQDFADTLSFLDRRINNIIAFHGFKKKIKLPILKPFDIKL